MSPLAIGAVALPVKSRPPDAQASDESILANSIHQLAVRIIIRSPARRDDGKRDVLKIVFRPGVQPTVHLTRQQPSITHSMSDAREHQACACGL